MGIKKYKIRVALHITGLYMLRRLWRLGLRKTAVVGLKSALVRFSLRHSLGRGQCYALPYYLSKPSYTTETGIRQKRDAKAKPLRSGALVALLHVHNLCPLQMLLPHLIHSRERLLKFLLLLAVAGIVFSEEGFPKLILVVLPLFR